MSNARSRSSAPIPTGILVTGSNRARQAATTTSAFTASILTAVMAADAEAPRPIERPAFPRKNKAIGEFPWAGIITGASMAWMCVLMLLALHTASLERLSSKELQGEADNVTFSAPSEAVAPVAATQQAAPETQAVAEAQAVAEVQTSASATDPEAAAEPASAKVVTAPKLPFREAQFVRIDDAPPPLQMPSEEANPGSADLPAHKRLEPNVYANCARIGTDVLFVKDPPEAFKRARAEKKLVFMVHLSGNLEDKEFT